MSGICVGTAVSSEGKRYWFEKKDRMELFFYFAHGIEMVIQGTAMEGDVTIHAGGKPMFEKKAGKI